MRRDGRRAEPADLFVPGLPPYAGQRVRHSRRQAGAVGMNVEFEADAAFGRELIGDLVPYIESHYSGHADP